MWIESRVREVANKNLRYFFVCMDVEQLWMRDLLALALATTQAV